MRVLYVLLCVFLLFGCSCDLAETDPKTFRVLSYNVQSLFDARLDGDEYPEYQDPKVWTRSAYRQRLKALATVLLDPALALPDILFLQEVEGPQVIEDLLTYHLARKGYRWYAVAKGDGQSIAVAVVSRHPLSDTLVHGTEGIRPILEVVVETDMGPLVFYTLHAKSQIGELAQTEALRLALSATLKEAVKAHAGRPVMLCGDFNEDPDAIWEADGMQTALVDQTHSKALAYERLGSLVVGGDSQALGPLGWYSPYLDQKRTFSVPGSCNWDGTWHQYDQILGNRMLFDGMGWEFFDFRIKDLPSCLDADGRPNGWNLATLSGLSDHLPVLLTLKRR